MSSSPQAHTHICGIVPPHLLKAIAASSKNADDHRQCAEHTLSIAHAIHERRVELLKALTQPRGFGHSHLNLPRRSIVPEHLLQAVLDSQETDEDTRACAKRDLEHIRSVHTAYQATQQGESSAAPASQDPGEHDQKALAAAAATTTAAAKPKKPAATKVYRAVYDAQHTENEDRLPGKRLRVEGGPATGDKSADDAYENCGLVIAFYKQFFNWNSIDNKGAQVLSSVHFGKNYENAYWDPVKMQMVYGDGSKDFLTNFAGCIDVIGHEMTHAVTEHTSPLDYENQSGALNEHISDVFGIMCKQWVEKETSDKADWLIGEYCLVPGVKGVALRSMKAPGTAYDDPRFGKDPQPDNMSGYKAMEDDNGGVHVYSGIPNKAFYLFSSELGGYSYEKAGQVWWKTMNSGRIPPKCSFLQFADATVEQCQAMYGDDTAKKLRNAWNTVGVQRTSII